MPDGNGLDKGNVRIQVYKVHQLCGSL
uniref:Uncharacterized protein n=1 Tax=Rhizophora mucronata TaxID=61149 RepID=A0A2P2NE44_RHIMU